MVVSISDSCYPLPDHYSLETEESKTVPSYGTGLLWMRQVHLAHRRADGVHGRRERDGHADGMRERDASKVSFSKCPIDFNTEIRSLDKDRISLRLSFFFEDVV